MTPDPTMAAKRSAVPSASEAADLIQLLLADRRLQLIHRQSDERVDATRERRQCLLESAAFLLIAASHGGGIRYAPMRAGRMSWPDRTRLRGRGVTDGENEIQLRRSGRREFVPA